MTSGRWDWEWENTCWEWEKLPSPINSPTGFTYELRGNSFPLTHALALSTNHDSIKLIQELEKTTGLKFGSSENPLYLAVEQQYDATAIDSVVLNIGLNDSVVEELAKITDHCFAFQCYRTFVETFSSVVFNVAPQDLSNVSEDIGFSGTHKDLDVTTSQQIIKGYLQRLQSLGHVIPQDPWEQLSLVVQKLHERSPVNPIYLKVQALLISDIRGPAISIDPSDKSFFTLDHNLAQDPTLLLFRLHSDTPSPSHDLNKYIKNLNSLTLSHSLKDNDHNTVSSQDLEDPECHHPFLNVFLLNSSLQSSTSRSSATPKTGTLSAYCRLKPTNAETVYIDTPTDNSVSICISKSSAQGTPVNGPKSSFPFTSILTKENIQVYEEVAAPAVGDLFNNVSSTLFTYGGVASGKTYTFFGSPTCISQETIGLIPLSLHSIFHRLVDDQEVLISFLRLNDDAIYDLMQASSDTHGKKSPTLLNSAVISSVCNNAKITSIPGLSQNKVSTLREALELLSNGNDLRQCERSKSNLGSTRSHFVLSIQLVSKTQETNSKLCFVDLAAPIQNSDLPDKQSPMFKQCTDHNKSLFFLEGVLSAVTSGQPHVPYRNCLLTSVLRFNMFYSPKLIMIACLSLDPDHASESLAMCLFFRRIGVFKRLGQQEANLKKKQLLNDSPLVTPSGSLSPPMAEHHVEVIEQSEEKEDSEKSEEEVVFEKSLSSEIKKDLTSTSDSTSEESVVESDINPDIVIETVTASPIEVTNQSSDSDQLVHDVISYSKVDSTEMKDVVLEFKEDPEPTSPWITKVKDNWNLIGTQRNIIIGLSCVVLVILAFLLFFFLRSSAPPTFLVSGTVTSDTVPLSGVLVFGDDLDDVYSDDDGFYELRPLTNGVYELTYELIGYDLKSVNVTVFDNDKTVDVSLSLNTFIVSGTVTSDSVPLSGVIVFGDDLDDVYTVDDGSFQLQPLVNGDYELHFELEKYDPKSVNVTVSDSNVFINVSVLLAPTFNVSGTVTSDSVPLPGVLVFGDDLDDVYSDENGLFALEPLVNGIYELNFQLHKYDSKSVNVTISDFNVFVNVSLLFAPTFNVSGTVTSDSVPLPSVLVFGDVLDDVFTDDDGQFEIEPLPTGHYELNFYLEGYDPKSINVTVSDSDKFVDVSLDFLLSLELIILDDVNSEPIPNPRVKLINQNLIVDGNEEGHIVLDLIAGDYELTVIHPNYFDRTVTIQIFTSKTESVSMTRHGFTSVSNSITGYNASFGFNVVIPTSLNGDVITTIGESAFQDKGLTSVVIPDSVQTIEGSAFKDNFIVSLTLNSGLLSIGDSAFKNNNLEELVIPDSVTTLGSNVLSGNSISSLVIPNGVTQIPDNAFRENQLSSITLPDSLVSIGTHSFFSNHLTDLIVPSSVTSIGLGAFRNNQISTLILGSSLKTIGIIAFGENQLIDLVIPDSVTDILSMAFISNKLEHLVLGSGLKTIENSVFQANSLATVDIPENIISIGSFAFASNQIEFVVFHDGITSIGSSAFNDNLLTSVSFPVSFTTISGYAFANNKLTSVNLPPSVSSIGQGAFSDNQLESVVLPEMLVTIVLFAFENNKLTEITFPGNVTSIGEAAFKGNQLVEVIFSDNVVDIAFRAFYENKLTNVILPANLVTIGSQVFDRNSLVSVQIGQGVSVHSIAIPGGFASVYESEQSSSGLYTRTGPTTSDWSLND
ncbi:hypothetical protein GEMRC1_001524 [Eukaryota sp. GEM-RC1]